MTAPLPDWLSGLDHRDWLFDGYPITKNLMNAWSDLDWPRAWMDMGPSPAGNPGPYWHVPRITEDTVHRLYPSVQGKWLGVIQQAIKEATDKIKRKSPGNGEVEQRIRPLPSEPFKRS